MTRSKDRRVRVDRAAERLRCLRWLAYDREARGRHLGVNGAKRWIGNATFADYVVIYARDLDDNNVKAFVVEKGTRGSAR
jgi:alkylation response protein AidB-like acyl-CoA dehydrogenase